MKIRATLLTIPAFLSACTAATTADSDVSALESFANMYQRTFETPPENTKSIIRDRRVRVKAEALEGVWFYTQLNTGEDGKLYRQRLSNLTMSDDGKTITQKTYGLNDPAAFENAWEQPERLSALTENDFERYFTQGCEQIWTPEADGEWSGYVDPKTCVISSKRRNKDIRIESEGYLSKAIYRTNERGYEMDMTFLWGTKPGDYIELYPVR